MRTPWVFRLTKDKLIVTYKRNNNIKTLKKKIIVRARGEY